MRETHPPGWICRGRSESEESIFGLWEFSRFHVSTQHLFFNSGLFVLTRLSPPIVQLYRQQQTSERIRRSSALNAGDLSHSYLVIMRVLSGRDRLSRRFFFAELQVIILAEDEERSLSKELLFKKCVLVLV